MKCTCEMLSSLVAANLLSGQTKSDQISEIIDFNEVRCYTIDIFPVQFKTFQDVLRSHLVFLRTAQRYMDEFDKLHASRSKTIFVSLDILFLVDNLPWPLRSLDVFPIQHLSTRFCQILKIWSNN
ncbi:hypothetical protein TNCV_716811 [Trichonephila clavipes]|nr:hypothetical protein TNCV_716811 [Trichonephila clavipes]